MHSFKIFALQILTADVYNLIHQDQPSHLLGFLQMMGNTTAWELFRLQSTWKEESFTCNFWPLMAFSSSAWNYQEPVNTNQKPCEHITVMVELKVSNKCLKFDVIWLLSFCLTRRRIRSRTSTCWTTWSSQVQAKATRIYSTVYFDCPPWWQ